MGIGTLGFLKGASKIALDSIDAREEAERQRKLQQDLIRMRAETEELFERKKVKVERPDYAKGKASSYNAYGDVIGERDLTDAEKEDYLTGKSKDKLSLDQATLNLDKTRGEIADRTADNKRADRLADAQIGSYNRSNRGTSLDGSNSGAPVTLQDRVQEALYRNKDLITSVTTAKGDATPELDRRELEIGIDELIRNMAARNVPPSQIDSLIRNQLIANMKLRKKQRSESN